MVLEEPRPSVTLISERPPEFSILLLAIVLKFPQLKRVCGSLSWYEMKIVFLQLEGIAAPYRGMRYRLNFDAVASPALARMHLGARTSCIHSSVFLRLRGSQLPIHG